MSDLSKILSAIAAMDVFAITGVTQLGLDTQLTGLIVFMLGLINVGLAAYTGKDS